MSSTGWLWGWNADLSLCCSLMQVMCFPYEVQGIIFIWERNRQENFHFDFHHIPLKKTPHLAALNIGRLRDQWIWIEQIPSETCDEFTRTIYRCLKGCLCWFGFRVFWGFFVVCWFGLGGWALVGLGVLFGLVGCVWFVVFYFGGGCLFIFTFVANSYWL